LGTEPKLHIRILPRPASAALIIFPQNANKNENHSVLGGTFIEIPFINRAALEIFEYKHPLGTLDGPYLPQKRLIPPPWSPSR
jgi:hypothetical protein